jgi:hypothetical protein
MDSFIFSMLASFIFRIGGSTSDCQIFFQQFESSHIVLAVAFENSQDISCLSIWLVI